MLGLRRRGWGERSEGERGREKLRRSQRRKAAARRGVSSTAQFAAMGDLRARMARLRLTSGPRVASGCLRLTCGIGRRSEGGSQSEESRRRPGEMLHFVQHDITGDLALAPDKL